MALSCMGGAKSEGTTSASVQYAEIRTKARRWAAQRTSGERAHSSYSSVSPEKVLMAARAILRHPPVKAESGTPEGRWSHEFVDLVGKARLDQRSTTSKETAKV